LEQSGVEVVRNKVGEIERGVDLPSIICETADRDVGGLKDGDIIVIASKVISKTKGYTISKPDLSTVWHLNQIVPNEVYPSVEEVSLPFFLPIRM